MSDQLADIEYHLARLNLTTSDTLVVRFSGHLSVDVHSRIRDQLKAAIPENARVLVIDDRIDLSILTTAEIAERTA